jgi:CDP-glycerol glycerophosphotransferase
VIDDVTLVEDGDGTAFTSRMPLADLVDASNPDDPYLQHTVWIMRLETASGRQLVLLTGLAESLPHLQRSRLVTLTRSPGGFVNVVDSPPRLAATEATVKDAATGPGILLVTGRAWATELDPRFGWRRFLAASDNYVEVACRTAGEADRWSAAADIAELVAQSPDDATGPAEWGLFVTPPGGAAYPLGTDPFLASQLPVSVAHGNRTIVVRPRTGTFHLEIR